MLGYKPFSALYKMKSHHVIIFMFLNADLLTNSYACCSEISKNVANKRFLVGHDYYFITKGGSLKFSVGGGLPNLYNKMCIIISLFPISSHKMCEASAEHILLH